MEYFVDWPTGTATRLLAAVVGVLLAGTVLLALRAPLLRRLGLRNIGRRRLRATLIVVGLALSTTVFGSALSTGDTITYTLQSLVAGTLGSVDEVVVLNPPRTRIAARLAAVLEPGFGGLAAAHPDFFPIAEFAHIQRAAQASPAIAAVAPAILEQVTVVNPGSRQLQSAVPLLAIAAPIPEAFGVPVTEDGRPVALDALQPDEVVLNTSAAAALNAQSGTLLEMHRQGTVSTVRIRAVTRNGGLGGTGALLLLPLASYQQTRDHTGEINLILVTNHGGVASVARSDDAARDLRAQLADPVVVRRLHSLMAAPVAQRGLRAIEDTVQGRDREAIGALRTEAARPEPTAEFISLVSEPRMRQRLLASARSLPVAAEVRDASRLLGDLAPLSVLAVKQEALVEANTYGSVITMIFLVLGIFSMAAAALLIGLIFVLLAADRGAELATMRAIGMRRDQILSMFLLEGLVYNLLGAALGVLSSLGATYLLARTLGQALVPFVVLRPHVELRSLLIAAMGGVVLTFITMLAAAWRVSHTAIVGATHGEVVDERPGRLLLLLGVTMLAGSAAIRWWAHSELQGAHHPLAMPWSNTLVLTGVVCCVVPAARTSSRRNGELVAGLFTTTASAAVAGVWLRVLAQAPAIGDTRASLLAVVAAMLVLMAAAVAVVRQVLGPLLHVLDYALAGLGRVRAVLRPAAGALRGGRGRAGLTVAMFGMVICIMAAALTLIDVALRAYGSDEPPVAGFDLRGELPGGASLGDPAAALASAPAISATAFTAIGSIAEQEVQAVELGTPRASWQAATLAIADEGFLKGIRASIEPSAAGYRSAEDTWRSLHDQPGTAIMAGRLTGGSPQPAVLWVRPPRGGRPIRLAVSGVLDPRSRLEPGIYVSRVTAAEMGLTPPEPTAYYFAVQPGTRVPDAIEGLQVSFSAQGFRIADLGTAERIGRAVRLLLTGIVQGFMGLGLLAGIAALGLLGVQSVLERRQQLGTLRALGFTRRQVHATLVWEGTIVAGLGVTLGLGLGLLLARSVVGLLVTSFPELRFLVPWRDIILTAGIAWTGAALAIAVAAWQAGRVAPAEALRLT